MKLNKSDARQRKKANEPERDLSIVTALHNRLDLTQNYLESLERNLPETLRYEIILVDDLSTDGTRAFLQTLSPKYQVVLNETKGNYAINNNQGVRLARGKHIALLNNDLVLKANWYEPMARLLEQFPNAGAIGNIQLNPKTQLIDHAGVAFGLEGETFHRFKNRKALPKGSYRQVNAISAACVLMERERFLKIGGFDESYVNGSEDIDLCIRLRLSGYTLYVSHESQIIHHISSSPGRLQHTETNRQRLLAKWKPVMETWARDEWAEAYLARYARHFWKMSPRLALKAIAQRLKQRLTSNDSPLN